MSNGKKLAIAIGTAVGIATVATCVAIYMNHRSDGAEIEDVNDVVERAKRTVQKLNAAVETLRKSAAA